MKPRPNDKPTFALSYDTLQEIHTLTGMVCGWRMSLPVKMIKQAQKVHWLMLDLNHVPAMKQTDKCACGHAKWMHAPACLTIPRPGKHCKCTHFHPKIKAKKKLATVDKALAAVKE